MRTGGYTHLYPELRGQKFQPLEKRVGVRFYPRPSIGEGRYVAQKYAKNQGIPESGVLFEFTYY